MMRILLSLAILVLLAGFGAAYYLSTPAGRSWLDRIEINMQRAENRGLWEAGKPLEGTPDLAELNERLAAKGVRLGDPVFLRLYKLDFRVELWMAPKGGDGRYVHVATYPICYWSGRLGPKRQEGDLQAPEGYYTVDKSQLNPKSKWHRAFNFGFPNAYDQALGRTGSYLMMHGGCASIGCYAMTDQVIDELWTVISAALDGGQPRFAVLALPFEMTEENLELRKSHPAAPFWAELKQGSDLFDQSHIPPSASVCGKHYKFAEGLPNVPVEPVTKTCVSPLADAR